MNVNHVNMNVCVSRLRFVCSKRQKSQDLKEKGRRTEIRVIETYETISIYPFHTTFLLQITKTLESSTVTLIATGVGPEDFERKRAKSR